MEINSSGNLPTVKVDVSSAFGLPPETTPVQPPVEDKTPTATNALPPKEEGSAPKEQGPVLPKEQTGSEEGPKPESQDKLFKNKAEQSHKLVIDLLEDKFSQLSNGRIDDGELRSWFDSHPDLADTANRSKRVKDRFRSLMERDEAAKYNPEIKEKRVAQTRPDVKEINDAKPKENSLDGKPITYSDLEKFFDSREDKFLEKTISKQREESLEAYAASHQILDEEYRKFSEATKALYKTNSDWTFQDALDAARRALYPTKGAQTVVPGARPLIPEELVEKIDMTKPTELFSKDEFFGRKAKK